jgi:hypothetical protein
MSPKIPVSKSCPQDGAMGCKGLGLCWGSHKGRALMNETSLYKQRKEVPAPSVSEGTVRRLHTRPSPDESRLPWPWSSKAAEMWEQIPVLYVSTQLVGFHCGSCSVRVTTRACSWRLSQSSIPSVLLLKVKKAPLLKGHQTGSLQLSGQPRASLFLFTVCSWVSLQTHSALSLTLSPVKCSKDIFLTVPVSTEKYNFWMVLKWKFHLVHHANID